MSVDTTIAADNKPLSDAEENAIAKKNVYLYLICQSLGAASAPVNIALGGLVGSYLLDEDKSLATVPVTAYNIGVAIGAVISNMLMRKFGRKVGFMIGALLGICGLSASGMAITVQSFVLFSLALMGNGIASGFVQQYRFAAADRGTPDFKPKAISIIMIGGVAAAIIGPQLVIHTSDLFKPVPFAGAFYCSIILFILSFFVLSLLNPSNLAARNTEAVLESGRSIWEIMAQPKFVVAVFCGTSAYGLMSYLMTGAPLAMVEHGHSVHDSTLGIQWHVMAMFAPSFFTGHLISRFGKETIVAVGMLILIACAVVALLGYELVHFWGMLILLGLGWNFGFIGATAMVTDTYRPEEKNKAQGANDFIIFGSVAFASFMSGQSLNAFGWQFLNWMTFPVVALALASLLWLYSKQRSAS